MGTTSGTGTLYFTGVSTYSSDFQQIIQRAVSIAQLPVTNLQNQEQANTTKITELATLNPEVAALGNDVANLGSLASSGGLAATSSNSSIVSVTNTGATAPGTYTISNITSLASAASETSLQGYTSTQSVSTSGNVNLVVGNNTYSLDLTGANPNNIGGLADAINNANAGVNATILNAGSLQYLVVSANNTGATTLQVNDVPPAVDLVTNTGSGTETSLQSYADPANTSVSATGKLSLVVGTNTCNLDITGSNNLNGLVQAINNAGAGVTASVVNNGDGTYSLSIAGTGAETIQLNDTQSPVNLISNTNQGSNASFEVNGIATPITQSSNIISGVIPGVTFTLQDTTSGSVTLSLASDASQLSTALQSFVNDYNTLVGEVQKQYGQSAGPLAGDPLINQISADMQQLVTYWNPNSTSSIRSLSDLGITFDYSGKLSFDPTTFSALSQSQINDAFKFIGSSTTGLAALASNFTQLSDPISGLIISEQNSLNQNNTQLADQITTLNARVAQVQADATAQAQAADALCAELESQQSALDAQVQSLNYVLYGKPTNTTGG